MSFSCGEPSDDAMQSLQHLLRQASSTLLDPSTDPKPWLGYGPALGLDVLRHETASFLTKYDWPCAKEELILSSGASGALDALITLHLQDPDGKRPHLEVWIEEPTYHLAIELFRDHGMEPRPLPYRDDGTIHFEWMETYLQEFGRDIGMVYMNPIFHNPTGNVYYKDARRMIQLLETHAPHVLFVSDEPYRLLAFGPSSLGLPPLGLTSHLALTLGSFSKFLAPGLRLGYVQGKNAALLSRLAHYCRSAGGANPFVSAFVSHILPHFDLKAFVSSLQTRCDVLCEAIRHHFPTWSFQKPKGGYFLWVKVDDASYKRWKNQKDFALDGARCWVSPSKRTGYLRFCFARVSHKDIESLIRIMY